MPYNFIYWKVFANVNHLLLKAKNVTETFLLFAKVLFW